MSNESLAGEDRIEEFFSAIARKCHVANMAYCATLGQDGPAFDDLPVHVRLGIRNGVLAIAAGESVGPEDCHEAWLRDRIANGWTFGPVKDLEQRTHPNLVAWDDLPEAEQQKDVLFYETVCTALEETGWRRHKLRQDTGPAVSQDAQGEEIEH